MTKKQLEAKQWENLRESTREFIAAIDRFKVWRTRWFIIWFKWKGWRGDE